MLEFPQLRYQSTRLVSKTLTKSDTNDNLQFFTRKVGDPHRWEWDLTSEPLEEHEAKAVFAFMASLGGKHGKCYLRNPENTFGQGGGTPRPRAGVQSGENQVPLHGLPEGQDNIYAVGDFIQFSNHDKAYQVQQFVNSNAHGMAELYLYPKLRRAVTPQTALHHGKDVRFCVSLKNDEQDLQLAASQGGWYPMTFDFVEVQHEAI